MLHGYLESKTFSLPLCTFSKYSLLPPLPSIFSFALSSSLLSLHSMIPHQSLPHHSISSDEDVPLTAFKSNLLKKKALFNSQKTAQKPNPMDILQSRRKNFSIRDSNTISHQHEPNNKVSCGSFLATSNKHSFSDLNSQNFNSNPDSHFRNFPQPINSTPISLKNSFPNTQQSTKAESNSVRSNLFQYRSKNPFIKPKSKIQNMNLSSNNLSEASETHSNIHPFLLDTVYGHQSLHNTFEKLSPSIRVDTSPSEPDSENIFTPEQEYNSKFLKLSTSNFENSVSSLKLEESMIYSSGMNPLQRNQSLNSSKDKLVSSFSSRNPPFFSSPSNSINGRFYENHSNPDSNKTNQYNQAEDSSSYIYDFIGNDNLFQNDASSFYSISQSNGVKIILNSPRDYTSSFVTKSNSQKSLKSVRNSLNKSGEKNSEKLTQDILPLTPYDFEKSENNHQTPSYNNSPLMSSPVCPSNNAPCSKAKSSPSHSELGKLSSDPLNHPFEETYLNPPSSSSAKPVTFNNFQNSIPSSEFSRRSLLVDDYSDIDSLISDLEDYFKGVPQIEKRINYNLFKSNLSRLRNGKVQSSIDGNKNKVIEDNVSSDLQTESNWENIHSKDDSFKSIKIRSNPSKIKKALELISKAGFSVISFKLFINDLSIYHPIVAADFISFGSILSNVKSDLIIDRACKDWAFFDYNPLFKIQRPLNFWENLIDAFDDSEFSCNNYLIVKQYPLHDQLLVSNISSDSVSEFSGKLYHKKGKSKWEKSLFIIRDKKLELSVPNKNKRNNTSYSLECYDIYFPTETSKFFRTKFGFGLKPLISSVLFEKPENDYIKWFCVDSKEDLDIWINLIRTTIDFFKFKKTLQKKVQPKIDHNLKSFIPEKPLLNIGSSFAGNLPSNLGNESMPFLNPTQNDSAGEVPSTVNTTTTNLLSIDTNKIIQLIEESGSEYQTLETSELKSLGIGPENSSISTVHSNPPATTNKASHNLSFIHGSLLEKISDPREVKVSNQMIPSEIFKKGSLLSKSKTTLVKLDRGQKSGNRIGQNLAVRNKTIGSKVKFTDGSLLQNLPDKKSNFRPNPFFGKPLVDVDAVADGSYMDGYSMVDNNYISSTENFSLGAKPIPSKPLISIRSESEFDFSTAHHLRRN
ncbi:hypothetical protein AYI68_g651 [Smittium mucronatum]|uniref:PH domain-containing protein n=1 Tax=Smittium mucronatum TaxID=133383 RepID=A0A1R0H7H1_9FUNG|nr:hypothetical protein AYI68_g651 [Smittium mucronatum]